MGRQGRIDTKCSPARPSVASSSPVSPIRRLTVQGGNCRVLVEEDTNASNLASLNRDQLEEVTERPAGGLGLIAQTHGDKHLGSYGSSAL